MSLESWQTRRLHSPSPEDRAALPRSLRAGLTGSVAGQHVTSSEYEFDPIFDKDDDSPEDETGADESQSVINGMEINLAHRPSTKSQSSQLMSRNHRQDGNLEANKTLFEDLANKAMPPEYTEHMVKMLEKRADANVQRTYVGGVPLTEVQSSAIVLKVGLTFLPGADLAQVNRLEQVSMINEDPDQKDATWRVNTAGALLMQFDVSAELLIEQTDQTANAVRLANRRLRNRETEKYPLADQRALTTRGLADNAVTIDSNCVRIVNDLRLQPWDLQGTLIEVDGASLWNLIIDYRHLIAKGGSDMTFEDTEELLETMIENARRLCTRSPILFRMATRQRIMHSEVRAYFLQHHPFQFLAK